VGSEIRNETRRRLLSDRLADHSEATRKGGGSHSLRVELDLPITPGSAIIFEVKPPFAKQYA